MVKRCIGIDIDSSHVRAVQVSHTPDGFCIEKVFSAQARRSTDSIQDILKSLIPRHGFDKRAEMAISMPHNTVFFRNLETDSIDAEQIRSINSYTLEHNFPIEPDEIVAQVCSYRLLQDQKYSILAAAVPRKLLHEKLNMLAGAKMHPDLVDAEIFAIYTTAAINHPEIKIGRAIIAYLNKSYITLAVTQDNNILIVRNIPIMFAPGSSINSVQEQIMEMLPSEVQLTWRKAFGEEIEENARIYLVNGEVTFNNPETLLKEQLNRQIIFVNPYAKVKTIPAYNSDNGICIAEGLALRILAPQTASGINFLDVDNADIKPELNLRREFTIFTILVVAIAAVLSIGLVIQLSHLEAKYARVKSEIRNIFQQTLPEERNLVSPLVQLEQKLQSLQKYRKLLGSASEDNIGPVEILNEVSKSCSPELNIKIDNMLITTGSVRLMGNSQSFESIYSWQRLLEKTPSLSTVDVQDIRRESQSGLVRFTILAMLATQEQN